MKTSSRRARILVGAKLGIPIAIGYIPIGIAFGVLASSLGLKIGIGVALSSILYAGASQFVGVGMMAAGASTLEIVMTTFILNFRHFIMSSSLSQRLPETIGKRFLSVLAFGVTDESFAVASVQPQRVLDPWSLLGLNTIAYLAWNSGTLMGLLLGDAIPPSLSASMGIALYAMFVGLLVPGLKNDLPMVTVTLTAIATSTLIFYLPLFSGLASGWRILIATLIAAAVGSKLLAKSAISDIGNRQNREA
ncbi:AzlC family ABC transporter permease [Acidaminobacter hydrogenoformans]|uniref:4-azaleucine resistance probable transporter AzlC n=1 Tax=Acidaminobacter hydrogenoformans DSM 2784 TaxID=1120920 RepID=A0A1G5RWB9_9FIRM|nr:AzlC family ABC transporter permease [Acidaminobacter hydrogenoformans]SCZ78412.1 4-azaleucine resistance probable transporter AzlC [Acidaminobacter hydrogenoformans DSM 2784]